MKIQIKSVLGKVLYEHDGEDNSLRKTLSKAVSEDANLQDAYLQGAHLRDANLQGADLWAANLQDANLRGAYLQGAYLQGAHLRAANLQGADLQGAYLQDANLRAANLQGANLRAANLQAANLQDAYLQGAYLQGAYLQGAKGINKYLVLSPLSLLSIQEGKLKAYKYLNWSWSSPYQGFIYKKNQVYNVDEWDSDEHTTCGKGINVASLDWCLRETGGNIEDYIYVECEFDVSDIVAIPYGSDGKFRVKQMTITKKVTKKRLKELLKEI